MKKLRNLLITFILVIFLLVGTSVFSAVNASTPDEVIISQQDGGFVPLYTESPDSSLKEYSSDEYSSKDYRIFYTQTTFLALFAGYLILFKIKGINHDQKMHRRKK